MVIQVIHIRPFIGFSFAKYLNILFCCGREHLHHYLFSSKFVESSSCWIDRHRTKNKLRLAASNINRTPIIPSMHSSMLTPICGATATFRDTKTFDRNHGFEKAKNAPSCGILLIQRFRKHVPPEPSHSEALFNKLIEEKVFHCLHWRAALASRKTKEVVHTVVQMSTAREFREILTSHKPWQHRIGNSWTIFCFRWKSAEAPMKFCLSRHMALDAID